MPFLFFCSFALPALGADGPPRLNALISEATGVTAGDVDKAEGKKTLTLFDAYALTLGNAEKIAISVEEYAQSLARRWQALGAFLPRVSLKAQKMYPDNEPSNRTTYYGTGVSLYGRQPIVTGLDEWALFSYARHDKLLKKIRLSETASDLLLDVARSYYRLLQVEKGLKNREEMAGHYRRMLGELNRRVALGRSRKSEVLRTRSQISKLEAEIKSQKNELARARLEFNVVTGIPPDVTLDENEPTSTDFSGEEGDAMARRWDVKAAAREIELARARLLAARGGHLPSVYLEGSYKLYQKHDMGGRDYFFALGAELPLFSGGIVSARVEEAESMVKQAKLRDSLVRRSARKDIVDALQSYESSKNEMAAYKEALDSAVNNYAVTLNEYRLNLVTILDVLTSLTFMQSARDDYDRVMLQHRYNRVRLGVATGEFNGNGIGALRTPPAGGPEEK